jgi:predicted GNAT family acetyltransferase
VVAEEQHDVAFANNIDESRYEVSVNGELAGFSHYTRRDDRIVFSHTEVAPELEGRGIGSRLARYALDDAREQGLPVEARCPFIGAYIKRHPEYNDLLARPA